MTVTEAAHLHGPQRLIAWPLTTMAMDSFRDCLFCALETLAMVILGMLTPQA